MYRTRLVSASLSSDLWRWHPLQIALKTLLCWQRVRPANETSNVLNCRSLWSDDYLSGKPTQHTRQQKHSHFKMDSAGNKGISRKPQYPGQPFLELRWHIQRAIQPVKGLKTRYVYSWPQLKLCTHTHGLSPTSAISFICLESKLRAQSPLVFQKGKKKKIYSSLYVPNSPLGET